MILHSATIAPQQDSTSTGNGFFDPELRTLEPWVACESHPVVLEAHSSALDSQFKPILPPLSAQGSRHDAAEVWRVPPNGQATLASP